MDLESLDNLQNMMVYKVMEVTMTTENMMDLLNMMELVEMVYKVMKVKLTMENVMDLHPAAEKESMTLHGLFSVFAGSLKQSQRRIYTFVEDPCKSTTRASEPCRPAFKGSSKNPGVSPQMSSQSNS